MCVLLQRTAAVQALGNVAGVDGVPLPSLLQLLRAAQGGRGTLRPSACLPAAGLPSPLRPPSLRCAPPHNNDMQAAKQAGDFLLVGVHTDEDVEERRGCHLPIMNLHERALSVLSCRYVDEVVIGE